MDTRPLGKTGLQVSRLGLGLAALGRPGYINIGHAADLEHAYDVDAMEARAHAVLDAAWNCGIRYFDAARSYGRAEQFLASWLKARKRAPQELVIGSKWGYTYTADWRTDATHHEIKDHSLPTLQRQTKESRALLGDFLKLYQIHSATMESGVLNNQEVLQELSRLRRAGWTIGLSLSGPRQAETLRQSLTVQCDGAPLFGVVQATWNMLEPSAGSMLQRAHEAGLGVIVKEALANGRLTARNHDPAFFDNRKRLQQQADRLGTTIDALALAAVFAQPWVDVVLSGVTTTAHLESNAAALSVVWDEQASGVLAEVAEYPTEYWQLRSKLAWN